MRCPTCGFENADSAKFCSECGTALALAPARREERKVVSVVFADLVGSTARAERLDPEDVRAVLVPYHDRLRLELERFGGSVEKFIGDAVVGVFGAPTAHEDDSERAVRAALAIQDAIAELNDADPNLELLVRIGVNTGEALVSLGARPELGEAMVAGDVMNTCARLQAAAQPGGILVGDATYRLTSRAIEYREAEPVEAKGKSEALAAWIALAPRASFGLDVVQVSKAPLVGREREVELLAATLARARVEREPQLVSIVGVPGIGKSRLVRELYRLVDEDPELVVWRQGRSLPYGESAGFRGIAEIVKAQAGILESDDAAEAGHKLQAAIRDLVDESESEWLERHLRPLVGLGGAANPGREQRTEAFSAWRRFLEALGERAPVVLVFEDLQWADDGLLDFVDELAERLVGIPLLVVCTARPELLERRPGWGGGKRNALTVSLARLSDDDTARLLAALLERSVLPADQQGALLQRAGGNPLYAEEYARMLADGEGASPAVPETLQGVVAARIDALSGEEKLLLQRAAVLGKVFWTDALTALSGHDEHAVEDLLFALERKEFVRREQRSAVAGAKQYVFVHSLVRDGAYGQMPRGVRAEAHGRVADWIDSLPSDRVEDRSEMLAYHLVQAIELGRAAGHEVSELVPRAAQALQQAGDRAWGLGSPHAALPLYEQSAAFYPEVERDPYLLLRLGRARLIVQGEGEPELARAAAAFAESDAGAAAEAEIALGERIWQKGDQEPAFRHFDRAAAFVDVAEPSVETGWVVAQLARFLSLAGRNREAAVRAGQAIAVAERDGDTELLGDALNTRGIVRSNLGEPGWIEDFERSLELALANNSWRAGRAYLNLGSTLFGTAAELARAEDVTREGLRYVERQGHAYSEHWYRGNLAECLFYVGKWDEALDLAEKELAHPEPHYMQQLCRGVRARIALARGAPDDAFDDARIALAEARAIRDPQALVPGLSSWLFVLASRGDQVEANRALSELRDVRSALEADLPGPWVLDLAFSVLELGHGREREADDLGVDTPWREAAELVVREELVQAADALAALGARTFEAHARLRAAARLREGGRHGEADKQLAQALGFYHEVGATAAVREGEALLSAAG